MSNKMFYFVNVMAVFGLILVGFKIYGSRDLEVIVPNVIYGLTFIINLWTVHRLV